MCLGGVCRVWGASYGLLGEGRSLKVAQEEVWGGVLGWVLARSVGFGERLGGSWESFGGVLKGLGALVTLYGKCTKTLGFQWFFEFLSVPTGS